MSCFARNRRVSRWHLSSVLVWFAGHVPYRCVQMSGPSTSWLLVCWYDAPASIKGDKLWTRTVYSCCQSLDFCFSSDDWFHDVILLRQHKDTTNPYYKQTFWAKSMLFGADFARFGCVSGEIYVIWGRFRPNWFCICSRMISLLVLYL